jgi:quercetin dioxygenase-like cupin family protein
MKSYHYTEVPAELMGGLPGVSLRWVIGKNVGAPNFLMRIIDVQPDASTEHHKHPWEHEVFVLEGEGRVRHAEGEATIGPGSCVYVAPNEVHQFTNKGSSVLRFICVIPRPPEP